MPRLGNDQRGSGADDPACLGQNDLELAWVALARQLTRLLRGLDVIEPHHPALGLRDHLLRYHDHVAGHELRCLRDERAQVVALAYLRKTFDRDDR